MTNILHNKLNKNMIDIIRIYILPCSDNLLFEKNICLKLLLDKTWNIFDDLEYSTINTKDIKIKKIYVNTRFVCWTIRQIYSLQ